MWGWTVRVHNFGSLYFTWADKLTLSQILFIPDQNSWSKSKYHIASDCRLWPQISTVTFWRKSWVFTRFGAIPVKVARVTSDIYQSAVRSVPLKHLYLLSSTTPSAPEQTPTLEEAPRLLLFPSSSISTPSSSPLHHIASDCHLWSDVHTSMSWKT